MWFETHNKAEQGRYDGMTGMTLKYAQMIDMEMDQNQLFYMSFLRLDEDPFANLCGHQGSSVIHIPCPN
jgi:hypothetical protein